MRGALPVVLFLLAVSQATATHVPCPPQDCPVLRPIPLDPYLRGDVWLTSFSAHVQVTEGIATTALELHLRANATAEATLSIPMPGQASLLGFNLTAGGKLLEGRVEEKGTANAQYDAAKAAGQDAAILEQASERLVRLRVNVPAGEERILRAAYVEVVPRAAGEHVYRLPLSQVPATHVDVEFRARSAAGVVGLRFPMLPLEAQADGAWMRAQHSYDGKAKDLVAVWGASSSPWSGSLVTSRAPGQPAEWVAEVCLRQAAVLPRDVVFVLDRSGSMGGSKIVEARESLRAVLATLSPSDHFDIVTFDDHVESFHGGLVPASEGPADQAKVAAVQARAGTDIDGGLQQALRELVAEQGSDRMPMVVFLTDGLPSAGVKDHDQIIERFIAANTRRAAIQVVPIGLDADTTFLADLALRSGGTFTPIDPSEPPVALRLGRLYDVVGHPTLRDVSVRVQGLEGLEMLPDPLPAIYEDGCLTLTMRGKAATDGIVSIEVSGRRAEGAGQVPATQTFAFAADAVPVDAGAERVWASAFIDDLLSQERVEGETDPLRATILAEAIRLRQVTPYTAWVIAEAVPQGPDEDATYALQVHGGLASSPGGAPPPMTTSPPMTGTGLPPLLRENRADSDGFADTRADTKPGTSVTQTPGPAIWAVALALAVGLLVRRRLRGPDPS